jgi:hypothetical protein
MFGWFKKEPEYRLRYRIVKRTESLKLEELVNELATKGWEPRGGVTIVQGRDYSLFYQVLVRYEPV